MMRVIADIRQEPLPRSVVAVGTFDGVHEGHKKILREAVVHAKERQLPAVALSFHPHPRQVIFPEQPFLQLTMQEEKRELLQATGIDVLALIPFDDEIRNLTPQAFVETFLLDQLGSEQVVIGYDHAFGRDRKGSLDVLVAAGKLHGFSVEIIPPVLVEGEQAKSSRIRKLLLEGNLSLANRLLGYPYRLTGRVHRMNRRGHDMGYPTANLEFPREKLLPRDGVYAGTVWVGEHPKRCVVNIGVRPTVDGAHHEFEVHILNFNEELYDTTLRVDLVHRLRDEQKFSSVEALKAQIRKDIESTLEMEAIS